ncbi:MAG: response regulator transcription factor [Spirochaetota bacterium]
MNPLTLITVDDEPHIHDGLDAIVDWDELGYRHAGSALNGRDGLDLVRSTRPDVVVTDIRMPGMDGLQMIEAVRSIPDYDPAIIVVSGYDDFDYARAALRLGVGDYLLKPIDEDELTQLLIRIRRSRAAGHAAPEPARGGEPAELIRRLLFGEVPEGALESPPVGNAPALGLESAEPCLYCLLVPAGAEAGALRQSLDLDAVRATVRESKAHESADYIVGESFGGLSLILLLPGGTEPKEGVHLWVKGLYRAIASELEKPVALIVDPLPRTLGRIADARSHVLGRLRARHAIRGAGVVMLDDAKPAKPTTLSPDPVLDAIERLDSERAAGELVAALDSFERRGGSADALRDWLQQIRIDVKRLVLELEGHDEPLAHEDDLRFAAQNTEFAPLVALRNMALAFVSEAIARVRELRRLNRNGVVSLVRRRVDRRYSEDLSLTQLADEYQMNPLYLGQLFRKVSGIGFREYLRGRRIREAQRLLHDTDLHMPEIAAMVGYRDVDFFAEQFKREVGATPSAYRAAFSAES